MTDDFPPIPRRWLVWLWDDYLPSSIAEERRQVALAAARAHGCRLIRNSMSACVVVFGPDNLDQLLDPYETGILMARLHH